jgi:hypothetical protein
MDISINSNLSGGHMPAEHRLQAALRDVTFLQGELDRTYEALGRIEGERPQDRESGCSQAVADVRLQLSEVVAIGAERQAIRQDTAALVSDIEAVQDQYFEMQQRMAAIRRQWFAGKATDGAADTQEQIGELQLRMATLRREWVSREITSGAVQPEASQLSSEALHEAVVCLA